MSAPQSSSDADPETSAASVSAPGIRSRTRQTAVWAIFDGVAVAALAFAAGMLALGLHTWNWNIPYRYDHDALVELALLKAFLESGDYHAIARLSAPGQGGLDLREFPFYVDLNYAVYRPLSWFFPEAARLMNAVLALGYPVIALSAWAVLRWAGVSRPVAVAAALLFALLPGHQARSANHLMYSCYFQVPLAMAVALGLALRKTRLPGGFGPSGRGAVAVALVAATAIGFGFVYFAFFSGMLWTFAAFYGMAGAPDAAARRRTASLSLALLALLSAATVTQFLPSILYAARFGSNPYVARRYPFESHTNGLLAEHLVLPAPGHRFAPAAALRARSDANLAEPVLGAPGESGYSALGLAATFGLVALSAALLTPGGRLGRFRVTPAFHALAACQLWMMAFAVRGGMGSLFSLMVSPQIRVWSRLSYFLGFGALLSGAWVLDRLIKPLAGRRPYAPWLIAAAVAGLGYLDQTTRHELPVASDVARRYSTDRGFVKAIEAALPAGAAVFQLPLARFPGHLPPGTIGEYEPIAGYLHSTGLKWSFAAIRMRSADKWQTAATEAPPAEMIAQLRQAGFAALWIDRRGYPDGAAALTAALGPLLPPQTPLSDAPGERLLFKL